MRNGRRHRDNGSWEAAMAEVPPTYGIAGGPARGSHCQERPDCNKNLIYIYFEKQRDASLLRTILQKHPNRVCLRGTFPSRP